MTETIMALMLGVFVTIYSVVRSFQTWQMEGGRYKVFAIAFAILAIVAAENVVRGILETLQ